MPLNWQQVRRGLDPMRFTVRSAPALLLRNEPWADYAEGERSLRAAIDRFSNKAAQCNKTAPRSNGRLRRSAASVA
jgi:bifunctional non-homologous end joining protein LigD